MNFILLFIAGLSTAIAGMLAWIFIRSERQKPDTSTLPMLMDLQKNLASLKSEMQSQIIDLSKQVNSQIQNNSLFLQESQTGFHKTVNMVQDRLGQLQQATHQMINIGKDISSLQDILKAPKLRGGLGELLLEELLRQILPEDHFALQYTFQSGVIVDAVIILGQGMIPVDAKFPLENFQRILDSGNEEKSHQAKKMFIQDVKKHIDQIATKYILPEEGTFEFALMYIPAENIYYETIIKDDMQDESLSLYAIQKKVIPVSPNSFYAYLQAIVRGLKGMRIERTAKIILESLGQLETEFGKCIAEFEKTGSHLSNAHGSYDKAMKRFSKLHDKLLTLGDVRKADAPRLNLEQPTDSSLD